jgi:pimeloyl-ACP methyl ester carboxylesterase
MRRAIHTKNGIEEEGFVQIGGIDQWIQIRGEDRLNPVVLFLHGGPGVSYIPFGDAFRDWEGCFTVVHWDQRGAGKTYSQSSAGDLDIDRMIQDGIEVAEHLRGRLGKDKVLLFAHSWGTILGLRMAQLRPDLFDGYVGAGQIVDMPNGETASYHMLVERLTASGNSRALESLQRAGPPPYSDQKRWMVKQRLIVMTSPPPSKGKLPDIFTAALFTPGSCVNFLFGRNA